MNYCFSSDLDPWNRVPHYSDFSYFLERQPPLLQPLDKLNFIIGQNLPRSLIIIAISHIQIFTIKKVLMVQVTFQQFTFLSHHFYQVSSKNILTSDCFSFNLDLHNDQSYFLGIWRPPLPPWIKLWKFSNWAKVAPVTIIYYYKPRQNICNNNKLKGGCLLLVSHLLL